MGSVRHCPHTTSLTHNTALLLLPLFSALCTHANSSRGSNVGTGTVSYGSPLLSSATPASAAAVAATANGSSQNGSRRGSGSNSPEPPDGASGSHRGSRSGSRIGSRRKFDPSKSATSLFGQEAEETTTAAGDAPAASMTSPPTSAGGRPGVSCCYCYLCSCNSYCS
jgi:hypothetical protein